MTPCKALTMISAGWGKRDNSAIAAGFHLKPRCSVSGIQLPALSRILGARNIALPGGVLEVEGKNLGINPSGEFKNEKEIGDVVVATSAVGTPVYARDLVDINRGDEDPPRFLNFYTWRDANGEW